LLPTHVIEPLAQPAAVAVHTTGVNVQGVLANVASITVILAAFGAVIVRTIKR
jgi:hypothetical protein